VNAGDASLDSSGSANRVRAAAAAEAMPSGPAPRHASGTSAAITNRFVNQEQPAPNAAATHAAGNSAGSEPAVSLLPSTPAKIDLANPPLGLDGHCPVSLFEQEKWVKGDARFGARHRGRTYLFASKQHADQFFANPDQYSPVLSGYDPILLLEGKQWVAGERQHGIWLENNRMYLFSSEQTLQRFWEEREHWVPLAEQAMREQAANRVR
jgi:protein disulfide-isomerase